MNIPTTNYFFHWKSYLRNSRFRLEFVFTGIILAALLFSLTRFLLFVESRNGVVLPDPVLALINPVDMTWPVFSLIYASLILSVIFLLRSPFNLLQGMQVYSLMILTRIICMYLVPLDPPAGHILLNDPFVETFGTGNLLTKDLFFSGHTATLLILFLVAEKGVYKYFLLAAIILVAVFVIIQHVHYTIDVLAALFITSSCFIFVKFLHRKNILLRELSPEAL